MKTKEEFSLTRRFTESLKKQVVKTVLEGTYTKGEAAKAYSISWMSVQRWLNKFGHQVLIEEGISEIKLKKNQSDISMKRSPESQDIQAMKKRIKELEKQLEEAELKAMVYDTMIDVAERELKIPIRKKYVTKQSKN